MADDLFYACPACGGPAVIEDDSLRCETCDDKRGSFRELYEHFQWGGPLARENAGGATLCELRDWMREHLGEFSVPKLEELRDRLVRRHGLTREQVMVAKLAAIVAMLRGEQSKSDVGADGGPGAAYEYHVGLQQMAAMVQQNKKTIRRNLYDSGKLPAPSEEGGNGKAHKWPWSIVRPILENEFGRKLPEVFPADLFAKS